MKIKTWAVTNNIRVSKCMMVAVASRIVKNALAKVEGSCARTHWFGNAGGWTGVWVAQVPARSRQVGDRENGTRVLDTAQPVWRMMLLNEHAATCGEEAPYPQLPAPPKPFRVQFFGVHDDDGTEISQW